MHETGDREALPRQRNRGLDRLSPGDRSEARERFVEPCHSARDRDRLVSHVVDPTLEDVSITIGRLADEEPFPLVLPDTRARGAVELDQRVTGLRAVHQHRAAAADAAHLRVDDALHERAGDGRVHRVAPSPHDIEPDLRSLGLRADDDRHAT